MPKRIRPEIKFPEISKTIISAFESTLEGVLASLQHRGDKLCNFNGAWETAILLDAIGEDHERTVRYMNLALHMGVAHFVSALELPEEFDLVYEGSSYPYVIEAAKAYVDPESWLTIVYLAIVLREADALRILCRIPTAALRGGNSISPESAYHLVDLMKGLFDRSADIGNLLKTAMEHIDTSDYMVDIRLALLGLYGSYFSDDEAEYREELERALDSHRAFWTATEEKKFDYNGWISLELLSTSAIAWDNKGWKLHVESDYVPHWLANGELIAT